MAAVELDEGMCDVCGVEHNEHECHEYQYSSDNTEDEMICNICLCPIVAPLDTHCGHTFCNICITDTVRKLKMCPLDRNPLKESDLRESNFAFKKLLDKLKVKCPNCGAGMDRGRLADHINNRCRSKRVKCSYKECTWKGPSNGYNEHLKTCTHAFQNAPVKRGCQTTIEFDVNPNEILGISIVGGNETPLIAIIIQEVFPVGAVKKDGRVRAGDIIMKVNDEELQDVPHIIAKKALDKAKRLGKVRFSLYREQRDGGFSSNYDIIRVSIMKNKGVPLGITLSGKRNTHGVYIVQVESKSVAGRDGRLKPHDRVVEINGRRVGHMRASRICQLFKEIEHKLEIVIARVKADEKVSLQDFDAVTGDPTYQPLRLAVIPRARAEKTFLLQKHNVGEKLGMSLAGGCGPSFNVPIYVSKIGSEGCVGRSGKINIGDILLAVNGKKLAELSHRECLTKVQKASKDSRTIKFTIIEADDIEAVGSETEYRPSWLKWLALPQTAVDNMKRVRLDKGSTGSLGIIITGGMDSTHGPQPIFIQSLVPSGVAYKSKQLRNGDIIVKANDQSLTKSTHEQATTILRCIKSKADLVIKTWPGTLL